MSAGSLFQTAGAVASQLRLSLSRVLKSQESNVQLGPKSGDDETCDEPDYHRTVDNNSAGSRSPLRLKNDRPTTKWQPLDNEKRVEK